MNKAKEEREADKLRKQKIRELWQTAEINDLDGFNDLIDKMKRDILEDIYEAEMDTYLKYGKKMKKARRINELSK